jgi:hypothetical protein
VAGRAGLVLIVTLSLGGCTGEELPLKEPPRLTFSDTTHRYGQVRQGAPVEHTFAFANDGGVALTIMQLRAACDTTAALVGGDEVPPGGQGAVQVRFDTAAAYGPQRRTVTVYSNDPERRAVVLALAGDVALDVAAEPSRVHLGTVPPGAPGLREVALLTADSARFAAPTGGTPPQLQIAIVEHDDGARLAIGTAPDAPLGAFHTTLRIPTPRAPRPVVVVVVGGTSAADAPTPAAAP